MDRDIGSTAQQGDFELLDEQTLAAYFPQRLIDNAITSGGDGYKLRGDTVAVTVQQGLDVAALP